MAEADGFEEDMRICSAPRAEREREMYMRIGKKKRRPRCARRGKRLAMGTFDVCVSADRWYELSGVRTRDDVGRTKTRMGNMSALVSFHRPGGGGRVLEWEQGRKGEKWR
jgi:hypothetical protein